MNQKVVLSLVLVSLGVVFGQVSDDSRSSVKFAEQPGATSLEDVQNLGDTNSGVATLARDKRTLLLKKKLLGAGAIGLGLGVGLGALKGYKYGRYSSYGGGYGGYGGGYGGGYAGGYSGGYGGGYGGYIRSPYSGYGNSYGYGAYSPSLYNRYPYVNNYNTGYYSSRPSYYNTRAYPYNYGGYNNGYYNNNYLNRGYNNGYSNGWSYSGTGDDTYTGSISTVAAAGATANNGGYIY